MYFLLANQPIAFRFQSNVAICQATEYIYGGVSKKICYFSQKSALPQLSAYFRYKHQNFKGICASSELGLLRFVVLSEPRSQFIIDIPNPSGQVTNTLILKEWPDCSFTVLCVIIIKTIVLCVFLFHWMCQRSSKTNLFYGN